MTKKFIVLDVEGMSNKRPYNIGYIVADRYGSIYKKRSVAILSAIIENLNNCEQAKEMTHKNKLRERAKKMRLARLQKINSTFTGE